MATKRGRKPQSHADSTVPELDKPDEEGNANGVHDDSPKKRKVDEPAAPAKRGRGRPPKPGGPTPKPEPVPSGEKKKRGRPAKGRAAQPKKPAKKRPMTPEDDEDEDEVSASEGHSSGEEMEAKPKKGRGRPIPAKVSEDSVEELSEDSGEEPKPKKNGVGGRKPAAKGGRARKASSEEEELDEIEVPKKRGKAKTMARKPPAKTKELQNPIKTAYTDVDFGSEKKFNLKISSWNVAGIRAWLKKNGPEYIEHEKPDIFCLQEIKCVPDQIPDEAKISGYHPYWLCKPGGHAGIAIYSKKMPINVEYGIGDKEQDEDGRIMTAEYEKFFLICVYVPNSGRKLVTLPKRMRWNELFDAYVQKLNEKKPVIICGDMNVSHLEIDLANPKTNKRNAGFTQEERDGMTKLLSLGYVDTFRHFYPDMEKAYTFWTYMGNARAKNVGWRLDYFIVSERFLPKVVDNVMRSKILGSDHCPITLLLNV